MWLDRRTRLFVAAVIAFSTPAMAATITWDAAQNITGAADVNTSGTLIGAYSVSRLQGSNNQPNATVNGVPFRSMTMSTSSAAVPGFALSTTATFSTNLAAAGQQTPYGSLPAEYQAILQNTVETFIPFPEGQFPGGTATLLISGLVAGAIYGFQWWADVSYQAFTGLSSATAGNSVQLRRNTTAAIGGVGQYAIGRFTADGSTQTILLGGPPNALFNAFQLRQLSAVPDEGGTQILLTCSLALIFSVGWLARRPSLSAQ